MESKRFWYIVFGVFLLVIISLGLVYLVAPDSNLGSTVGDVSGFGHSRCLSTGLGSPTVSPVNPSAGSSFIIRCPVTSQVDCISAIVTGGNSQCTWSDWSGNNGLFNCTGISAGTYTATCKAVTGTSDNCCAATFSKSYKVVAKVTTTTTTTKATTTTTRTTTTTTRTTTTTTTTRASTTTTRTTTTTIASTTTTLPSDCYGAENCNPTGNPIGGGVGYNNIISQADARVKYVVSTKDQFLSALGSAKSGEVIFIPRNANIDLSGVYGALVPGGVIIASDRGLNGSLGGRIYRLRLDSDPGLSIDRSSTSTLYISGDNVRVTGLRLEGPDNEVLPDLDQDHIQYGIVLTNFRGLEVDNCEIYGWSGAGILQDTWHSEVSVGGLNSTEIGSGILYIHHNYIHHCQNNGLGYAVGVYRNGAALIKANIFDYTRHAIASDGYNNSGYEASYNVDLGHSTDHFFDVHKDWDGGNYAGTLFRIHHNTVYVGYPLELRQPWSVAIRAVPQQQVYIYNNDFRGNTTYWGVAQSAAHDSPVTQYDFTGTGRINMSNNLVEGEYHAQGPIKICHQTTVDDFSCGYT